MIIKYAYIPEGDMEALDEANQIEELLSAMKDPQVELIDVLFINNITHGIGMNKDLNEFSVYCKQGDLMDYFVEACRDDIKNIVINGFDLKINEVRKNYLSYLRKYDVTSLYINVFTDKYEEPIHIGIDPDSDLISDEEWEKQTQEIKDEIKELQKEISDLKDQCDTNAQKKKKSDVVEGSLARATDRTPDAVTELFKQLLGNKGALENLKDLDVNVEETLSYVKKDYELHVSRLDDSSLLISDDESDIIVDKSMVKFLLGAIKDLVYPAV